MIIIYHVCVYARICHLALQSDVRAAVPAIISYKSLTTFFGIAPQQNRSV